MDPVTHMVSGGLVSRISKAQDNSSRFLWLCLVSSMAPDVDFAIGILGPEAALIHHRGITHSLMGGLIIALLVTWIFLGRQRSSRFWIGLGISYSLILLHIFLDLVTSYGTQILAPFSNRRFSLDSVFIIDPVMTLTALSLLIMSIFLKKHTKGLAFAGVAFLLAYPLFNMSVNQYLSSQLKRELHSQGIQFQRINLIPAPLTPFFWKAILTDPLYYSVSSISIFQPAQILNISRFPRADTPLVRKAVQESSMFRTYMWFAAYPVVKTESTPNGTLITLTDLRFQTRLFGNRRTPFQLTGYFNSQMHLTHWEYRRPFRERAIQVLD